MDGPDGVAVDRVTISQEVVRDVEQVSAAVSEEPAVGDSLGEPQRLGVVLAVWQVALWDIID